MRIYMAERIVIKVPTLGESVVDATVAKIIKNPGDFVEADEAILELETDKVTLEVFAPESGTLEDLLFKEGDVVNVGVDLAFMSAGAALVKEEKISQPSTSDEKPQSVNITQPTTVDLTTKPTLSSSLERSGPASQKAAADLGVSQITAHGSGKDGRITKGDIIGALKSQLVENMGIKSSSSTLNDSQSQQRQEERIPLSRIRQRIAERLKDAQNTAAILTTFNEVDMSSIIQLRSLYKDKFLKKYGSKLGFMSFFVKACVEALKEQPVINSYIEDNSIVQRNFYDIGIAVSAPHGLVVPVIRDAQNLSFAEIENLITQFGQKAQEGKITIDELTGGSFTISNGGTFGSMLSTPIINPPQSAILGMHSIKERAVVVDGQIVIRPMMYLAVSYDHRLIDGREAVTFLTSIKGFLENPGRFVLSI